MHLHFRGHEPLQNMKQQARTELMPCCLEALSGISTIPLYDPVLNEDGHTLGKFIGHLLQCRHDGPEYCFGVSRVAAMAVILARVAAK